MENDNYYEHSSYDNEKDERDIRWVMGDYESIDIVEGQFDKHNGSVFGRKINFDRTASMGWMKNGKFHGFSKQLFRDKSSEEGVYDMGKMI